MTPGVTNGGLVTVNTSRRPRTSTDTSAPSVTSADGTTGVVEGGAFMSPVLLSWDNPETEAIHSLGFKGYQGEHMRVVENTDDVHNVIVCTLCSCYPWPVLGLPPAWYKGSTYRARVVREPRAVLAEFGTDVPANKEVRVWDSTAEIRYMVLPQRPAGTDGMSVEQLAALVTRDSMIGTSLISHMV